MKKDEIFQVIKNNTMNILPNLSTEIITIEKRLKDLGANSIDRMEILVNSMEDLNIKIPLIELGMANNIKELVDVLYKKISLVEDIPVYY